MTSRSFRRRPQKTICSAHKQKEKSGKYSVSSRKRRHGEQTSQVFLEGRSGSKNIMTHKRFFFGPVEVAETSSIKSDW